mmetsp:Transcript_50543/g.76920  ORF Transcript_50543/g.76920 Transcript_50543/m.76920 type:complete len:230 (-) Transcript_50543:676-1365(-)|eukprot:CAMPEP_0117033322 /NCGR_PEP_ID=MMETSP0472-20121206/23820_1 /TAXON_ID=693140 ORGANISM="Tiarina fusus, Strain LIS" /NCGR_SAMPLE_ID=MMETSP0472 /ASSEMBLY_ACC=CAM_ASM_000603 /LENGTH=229 /DNA_ID=CAMNT_0004742211 /DNA_START=52 /DNA_END=741 /DNA_ORIENTATION=+
MYRLFKGNLLLSRRSKKRSTVAVDKPKKNKEETPVQDSPPTKAQEVGENTPSVHDDDNNHKKKDIFRPKETREEHYLPIRLTRSLSRDSFSTFTTAAETPSLGGGSSLTRSVVIWGDLPMPAEIYICGGHKELGCGDLMRQTPLLPPTIGPLDACAGDEKNQEEDEDEDAKRCFLPKGMISGDKLFRVHPSKSKFYDSQIEPPPRQRAHSIGDDSDYLKAPERWTRFEI